MRTARRDMRRDAVTDALGAERFAERMETDEAWLVAADAWEEAGDDARSRFAWLRRPSNLGDAHAASREEALETRRQLDAWQAAELNRNMQNARRGRSTGGIPLTPGERESIERWLGFPYPSNESIGRLEVYQFLFDPPDRWFAYYNMDRVGGLITSFAADVLGRIESIGSARRPFGRGGQIRSVRVRAINGFHYNGTCAVEHGTYCRLRRGKPWRT